ncbi:MAG: hypothetical protein LW884_06835 [Bacteroidetes bacterium]|jgi:hypothetical protein|nr:hypothetical protein [Bacteroidota bacterium]
MKQNLLVGTTVLVLAFFIALMVARSGSKANYCPCPTHTACAAGTCALCQAGMCQMKKCHQGSCQKQACCRGVGKKQACCRSNHPTQEQGAHGTHSPSPQQGQHAH